MSAPSVPSAPAPTGADARRVELAITGMTCASCAARIERKLNRLDGVTASVNYATENARVDHPASVGVDDLVATVEKLGYGATVPHPAGPCRRPPRSGRRRRPAHPPAGQPGADAARRRARDGARLAVHVLAVALRDPRRARRRLGRSGLPPRGLDQPAPRRRDHGHPGVGGHARRARLVVLRPVPRRRRDAGDEPRALADRRRRAGRDLPRGRVGGDDVRAGRALVRGARQAPGRRRAARPARPRREGRRRAPRRARGAHPGRPARARRRVRRAPRRHRGHRRRRRRGPLGGRRQRHDRRVGARRRGPGRPGQRRDGRGRRAPRGARDRRRRRHPPGPDRPAGRGGPERQGRGAAPRRPRVRGVRARSSSRSRSARSPCGCSSGPERRRRSPRPSPSSSSPAPARWGWRRRPR